jgi:putative flippase GtrA
MGLVDLVGLCTPRLLGCQPKVRTRHATSCAAEPSERASLRGRGRLAYAMLKPRPMWRTRQVAGWFLIGLTASLVELALLRLLYEGLQWPLPVATATAAEVLIIVKFLVADRWVFGHAGPTVERLARYHGASAGAFVVYWLVVNALAGLLGLPYVAAFVVGTGAAFTWSLMSNFFWVWAS